MSALYYFGEQLSFAIFSRIKQIQDIKHLKDDSTLRAPWLEPVVPTCIVAGCVGLAFRIP